MLDQQTTTTPSICPAPQPAQPQANSAQPQANSTQQQANSAQPQANSVQPHTPPPRTPRVRRVPAFEPSADRSSRRPLALLTGRRRDVAPAPRLRHRARPVVDPVNPVAQAGARRVLQLSLEVLDGRRSPAQLRPLLPATLVDMVTTLARTGAGRGRRAPATLDKVRVQQVTPQVAEAFATVRRGQRVTAAVARLELTGAGWQCTALRLQ